MAADKVRLRLLHDGSPPIHDTGEPFLFGLQTTKQEIVPGRLTADGGLAFDFELSVRPGPDETRPVFSGPAASGSVADRFVYLSWKAANREGYVNRIKASLRLITWEQVRQAQSGGRMLQASLVGRRPHDTRPVEWTVA
ncbi:DUF5990 family protein [Phenylobacterium sp.]|jgi:hypothetical protein|uniref:DUF5990 family protein n=1 Tax=Phenylobacterium sp. TaxID=1871053 RepID=UPI0037C6D848